MSDVVVTVPKNFTHPAGPGLRGLAAWFRRGRRCCLNLPNPKQILAAAQLGALNAAVLKEREPEPSLVK